MVGTAIALYIYGAIGGMVYALDAGEVVVRSSPGDGATFHRAERPLLFWIAFLGLSLATDLISGMWLTCFWKVFKKG